MPTVPIDDPAAGKYAFRFYSADNSEPPHIHVIREKMTAKFWLEPLSFSNNRGFSDKELRDIAGLIEKHRLTFILYWNQHFSK